MRSIRAQKFLKGLLAEALRNLCKMKLAFCWTFVTYHIHVNRNKSPSGPQDSVPDRPNPLSKKVDDEIDRNFFLVTHGLNGPVRGGLMLQPANGRTRRSEALITGAWATCGHRPSFFRGRRRDETTEVQSLFPPLGS